MSEMTKEVILCVDDEQMILNSLNEQLYRHFGDRYIYEFAESGDEAQEIIDELVEDGHTVVMLISDQIMPGMKGDNLLINFNKQFPNSIKILLTGQAGLESAINAINNADLFRYLIKPWVEVNFISIIKKGLRQYYLISEMENNLVAQHLTKLETAGQEEYAESQAELIRQTVIDWTGKAGQIEEMQYRSKGNQLEMIKCEYSYLKESKHNELFKEAAFYRKCVEVDARQAQEVEIVEKLAGEADVIANIGDWIVRNPLDQKPYVIEENDFPTLYVSKGDDSGKYVSVGKPVKAFKIADNVAFLAPWGQPQIIKAGGYLIDNARRERYGIEEHLFDATYERIDHLPMRFTTHAGETVEIPCKVVDLHTNAYDTLFEDAAFYKKNVVIYARQATSVEVISTPLDATQNTASPGDWIVNNPGEKPYVIRAKNFSRLYQPKEGEKGAFVSVGKPVKGVQADEDIVFIAPWGELQAVQKAGSVLQGVDGGRYGIDEQSLVNTYMDLTHLPMRFKQPNGTTQTTQCKLIDLKTKTMSQRFDQADKYHKEVEVHAHQAEENEVVVNEANGSQMTAKPGDWVVTPPSNESYIILDEQFTKLYRPKDGEDGVYVSQGKPVNRIQIDEDVVFMAPWGELQGVETGGSLLENSVGERYGISAREFERDYRS